MWIVIVIFGLLFGLMAFSQIIYPLFVAWPKARKLSIEGKLKKPIPLFTIIFSPIFWTILIAGSIWIINRYFTEFTTLYYLVLLFILIVVIVQIPKQNKDLETDFRESWKEYLKEE